MNLTEKYLKIKEFISEYYWIAGIPLLIWGFTLAMNEKEDINLNETETYGMVYGSKSIHKQYSKRNYKYEFHYNGKNYTGTSTAYNSDNVQNGNYYKIEFSNKNPAHSRMIFELEYVQRLKTDENGKVIDTIFLLKDQVLRNEIKERIAKYKIEIDSIKN